MGLNFLPFHLCPPIPPPPLSPFTAQASSVRVTRHQASSVRVTRHPPPHSNQKIWWGEQEGRARPQSQSGTGSQGVAPAAWLASRFSLRAVGKGVGGVGLGHTGNQKTALMASMGKLNTRFFEAPLNLPKFLSC